MGMQRTAFIQREENRMGSSSFAALAGLGMAGLLIMLLVGVAVAALLLCVAFRLVLGYMPSFVRALGAVVVTAVADFVALTLAGVFLGGHGGGLLALAVEFVVGVWVVNHLLLSLDGSAIGYGKAGLVQLVYMVIGIVIGLLLFALLAMVFGAALFGVH
jgi:hypothetical protein